MEDGSICAHSERDFVDIVLLFNNQRAEAYLKGPIQEPVVWTVRDVAPNKVQLIIPCQSSSCLLVQALTWLAAVRVVSTSMCYLSLVLQELGRPPFVL
jgi:hypothetical protein